MTSTQTEPKACGEQEPLAAFRIFPPIGPSGRPSSPHVEVSSATARRQCWLSLRSPKASWHVGILRQGTPISYALPQPNISTPSPVRTPAPAALFFLDKLCHL